MRDKETTGTGIEASLTGHLVLATLHTNRPRVRHAPARYGHGPIQLLRRAARHPAQRLAKRLCSCKQPYTPESAELTSFLREYCEELMNTARFKADRRGRWRRCTATGSRPMATTRVSSPSTSRSAATSAATRALRAAAAARAADRERSPEEGDPGARSSCRGPRDRPRGRHAHAEAGRHGEVPDRRHPHQGSARRLHQVKRHAEGPARRPAAGP